MLRYCYIIIVHLTWLYTCLYILNTCVFPVSWFSDYTISCSHFSCGSWTTGLFVTSPIFPHACSQQIVGLKCWTEQKLIIFLMGWSLRYILLLVYVDLTGLFQCRVSVITRQILINLYFIQCKTIWKYGILILIVPMYRFTVKIHMVN